MFVSQKNKMSIQTLIFFLWLSITFLLFHLPVYSQETRVNMLLLDFEKIGGDQKHKNLEQEIPRQLKNSLNQSIETSINAELHEEIMEHKDSQKRIFGFPSDEELRELRYSLKGNFNYIIVGRFWEKMGIIRVEIRLIDSQTGGVVYSFSESEADTGEIKTIQERFAAKIAKYIETYLVGRIRIGLIDFKMTGGNQKFLFLRESLPTMLATGLSASREFKLIEIKSDSQIMDEIEKSREGIFDETTIIKVGRRINANYLIMGEFWEYENKIRADARCVSIETSEIILSEEIILDRIEIESISKEIKLLASKIRIMIEKDFMRKEKPAKSIAVVSYPPLPNNRINGLLAEQIRRTLVRKLMIASDLKVKEDAEKIKKYLKIKEDKLKICSDLEVSSLLTIQFEELHGNMIILNMDLYDIEKLTQDLFTESKRAKYKEVNDLINNAIEKTLKSLNVKNLDEVRIKESRDIRVPTFPTRWAIRGSYSLINRADAELYPKGNTGDYFEFSLSYQLNNRMKVELQAGIDIGGREVTPVANDELHMSCMLFSLVLKYDLLKTSQFDLYAGLGGTNFQVFRNIIGDSRLKVSEDDFGAGLMTLFGIEAKLKKLGIIFYLEPRYIFGTKVESKVSGGYDFRGGRLGGFYLTLGIAYNLNF